MKLAFLHLYLKMSTKGQFHQHFCPTFSREQDEKLFLANGIWQMAFGKWHLANGIWQMAHRFDKIKLVNEDFNIANNIHF